MLRVKDVKKGTVRSEEKGKCSGVFSLLLSPRLANTFARFACKIFQDGKLVFVKAVTSLPVSLLVFVAGLDLGVIERRGGSVVAFHTV